MTSLHAPHSESRRLIVALASMLLAVSALFAAPFPPAPQPALAIETDAYHRLFARFPTQKGFFYTVEESQDLSTWKAVDSGSFYGWGATGEFFLKQLPAPLAPVVGNSAPSAWISRIHKPTHTCAGQLYCSQAGGSVIRASVIGRNNGQPYMWSRPLHGNFPPRTQSNFCNFEVETPDALYEVSLLISPLPASSWLNLDSPPELPQTPVDEYFYELLPLHLESITGALAAPQADARPEENYNVSVLYPADGGSEALLVGNASTGGGSWFKKILGAFPPQPRPWFQRMVKDEPELLQQVTLEVTPMPASQIVFSAVPAPATGAETAVASLVQANAAMIQPSQSASLQKRYVRLVRREVDTNGNGVMDHHEFQTANYDPFATSGENYLDGEADDDGDGVSNGDEVTNGTSPTDADSDNDGSNDGQDPDAQDAEKFNTTLTRSYHLLEMNHVEGLPQGEAAGHTNKGASADTATPPLESTPLYERPPYEDMEASVIDTTVSPAPSAPVIDYRGYARTLVKEVASGSGYTTGYLLRNRIWALRDSPSKEAAEFQALILQFKYPSPPAGSSEIVCPAPAP
jgi:hypothetical protein